MALLRGRARLGALTLAYPHTPPFPSWGCFVEVRRELMCLHVRACCSSATVQLTRAGVGGRLLSTCLGDVSWKTLRKK